MRTWFSFLQVYKQKQFLHFFAQALNRVTSYESIADLLTVQIATIWRETSFLLFLPGEDDHVFQLYAALDADIPSQMRNISARGLLAWSLKQVRQPIWGTQLKERLEGHTLLEVEESLLECNQAALWVPFVFHSQIEGLLLVRPQSPSPRLEVFFQEMIPQCAAVLSNLRLIRTLRRQVCLLEENRAALDIAYQRILTTREEERQRLARELHDSPLQEILHCSALLSRIRTYPVEEQPLILERIQHHLLDVSDQLRVICSELYPSSLDILGLPMAMQSYVEKYPEFASIVELDVANEAYRMPVELSVHLFRIFQEALNNVRRHANATHIQVRLYIVEAMCHLTIQDNGVGFDVPASLPNLAAAGHFGLVGMWERVQAIGGQLRITSRRGEGTRIDVEVPLIGRRV
nr:sensor histidine kinase [Ardenticatena sp.]